jgi:hypothetical protein
MTAPFNSTKWDTCLEWITNWHLGGGYVFFIKKYSDSGGGKNNNLIQSFWKLFIYWYLMSFFHKKNVTKCLGHHYAIWTSDFNFLLAQKKIFGPAKAGAHFRHCMVVGFTFCNQCVSSNPADGKVYSIQDDTVATQNSNGHQYWKILIWILIHFGIIFQLYRGGSFYWLIDCFFGA